MGKNKWKDNEDEVVAEAVVAIAVEPVVPEVEVKPMTDKEPEIAAIPYVALDVYLRIHPLKPDQLAGFKCWAKASGKVSRTIPEWEKAYQEFMTRPVR